MKLYLKKLFLLCIMISTYGFAQQISYEKMDTLFNVLYEKKKLMGNMNIIKNDKEVYSKSIGYADLETKTKITNKTKFRIGSITKTFTAVIIFQLIEEEKLTLKTPLASYFPTIPNASKITIKHLLTHGSGLFNVTNDKDFATWMLQPSSQEKMLSRIVKYQPNFQPGERNEYSNTNFILLGYIAEVIDKKPYADILSMRITSKIGLEDTYAGTKIESSKNECYSYSLENSEWQLAKETDMSNPAGAGVIVSTANDITRFFSALFNKQLLSEESLKTMITTNGDYGYGIFTQEVNGMRMFGHNGGIDGFRSFAVYIPSEKLSLAVFSNAGNYPLMSIIMNGVAVSNGIDFEIPSFSRIALTQDQAKRYKGTYINEKVPFKLVIFNKDNKVFVEVPERNLVKEVIPIKLNQFKSEAMGVTLEFDLENNLLFVKEAGADPLTFKNSN